MNDTKTRLVGEMIIGKLRVGEMRIYPCHSQIFTLSSPGILGIPYCFARILLSLQEFLILNCTTTAEPLGVW